MLLRTLAALLALAIGGIATSTVASAKDRGRSQGPALDANWVLLETRAVDLKKEKERFTIGAGKGRFTSVMLIGVDRRIDINRVTIATDGEPYIDAEHLRLERGQRSHPIRFSHDGGVVENVDLSYSLHLGAAGPAKVELWGLRASPEVPNARSAPPSWVWIGTRSVDLKKEEDRIDVGVGKGRFKSLMLVGVDRLIDIDRVTVVTDGAAPRIEKRRLKLQKGQRSRPIQLGKDGQSVRHIDLSYRLHLGAAGPANVELWGVRVATAAPAIASPEPSARRPTAAAAAPAAPGGRKRTAPGPCSLACMRLARRRMRTSSSLVGNTAGSPGSSCVRSVGPSSSRNCA